MPSPGLSPGERRRSGRARTLTAKAQQHEQEEVAATYGEDEEGEESDAMEGVVMMTGDPVESITDGSWAADSLLTCLRKLSSSSACGVCVATRGGRASGHECWDTQIRLNRDKHRHQIQQGRLFPKGQTVTLS